MVPSGVATSRSALPAHGDSMVAKLVAYRAAAPDRSAFIQGSSGQTLTWAELGDAVLGWGGMIDELGSDRSARIGLLIDAPLLFVECFLTALAHGVTVAPLNPESTPSELDGQVRALGLAAVVTDQPPDRVAAACSAPLAVWSASSTGLRQAVRARRLPVGAISGDAAVVMMSSGTTGEPKIVPLREGQLLSTAASVVDHHGFGAEDRGYSPLPLFHINALVVGVLSTLTAGSTLIVDRRFSARSFWSTVAAQRATWLNLVPGIIAVLGSRPSPDGSTTAQVRFARSASAPLAPATRDRFEQTTGISVLETYGMTEAASQITANPLDATERRPGSVGRPVGVELRVVDSAGTKVPDDAIGHIQIRGSSIISGYWAPAGNRPTVRPALSASGWFSTGDLGRRDADGFVYLAGRSDDVINRSGEKVYPREVEEVLLADPAVAAAVVVGRAHSTLGEEPVAYVLAQPGPQRPAELAARLERRCAAELSRSKRPADIVVAEQLPVGATGKIRRAEVRRLAAVEALAG